jgi:hypothetical protein
MINPFVTQGGLNTAACTTILPEVPRLEQQAIPRAGIEIRRVKEVSAGLAVGLIDLLRFSLR